MTKALQEQVAVALETHAKAYCVQAKPITAFHIWAALCRDFALKRCKAVECLARKMRTGHSDAWKDLEFIQTGNYLDDSKDLSSFAQEQETKASNTAKEQGENGEDGTQWTKAAAEWKKVAEMADH